MIIRWLVLSHGSTGSAWPDHELARVLVQAGSIARGFDRAQLPEPYRKIAQFYTEQL